MQSKLPYYRLAERKENQFPLYTFEPEGNKVLCLEQEEDFVFIGEISLRLPFTSRAEEEATILPTLCAEFANISCIVYFE